MSNTDVPFTFTVLLSEAMGVTCHVIALARASTTRSGGPYFCDSKVEFGRIRPTTVAVSSGTLCGRWPMSNLDYCGIVILLRQLVKGEKLSKREATEIAAHIAYKTGVDIVFSL